MPCKSLRSISAPGFSDKDSITMKIMIFWFVLIMISIARQQLTARNVYEDKKWPIIFKDIDIPAKSYIAYYLCKRLGFHLMWF